jgi:hypothetical protein
MNQSEGITSCEHTNNLSIFIESHHKVVCNECFFNFYNQEKAMTVKQAANKQVEEMKNILI